MMMYSTRPRRQMLTQQQRNNKRQRANPQQLAYLRRMFNEDSKPDQKKRELIGKQIDMTPRSVQIWFQNNRAKAKTLERKVGGSHYSTVTTYYSDKISGVHLDYSLRDDFDGSDLSRTGTPSSSVPVAYAYRSAQQNWSPSRVYADSPDSPAYSLRGYQPFNNSPSLSRQSSLTREILDLYDSDSADFSDDFELGQDGEGGGLEPDVDRVDFRVSGLSIGDWHRASPESSPGEHLLEVRYIPQTNTLECICVEASGNYSISIEIPPLTPDSLRRSSADPILGYLAIEIQSQPEICVLRCDDNIETWSPCDDFTGGSILSGRILQLVGHYEDLVSGASNIEMIQNQQFLRDSIQDGSSPSSDRSSRSITPPPAANAALAYDEDIRELFDDELFGTEGDNKYKSVVNLEVSTVSGETNESRSFMNEKSKDTIVKSLSPTLFPLDLASLSTVKSLSVPISPCQVAGSSSSRSYSEPTLKHVRGDSFDIASLLPDLHQHVSEPFSNKEPSEVSSPMLKMNLLPHTNVDNHEMDQLFMLLDDTGPRSMQTEFAKPDVELDSMDLGRKNTCLSQW